MKSSNLAALAMALTANSDGSVSGETPAAGDSSAKLATTEFVNPGALLGANGYQKLPSGLIIQWGSVAATGGSSGAVTYPTPFPHALFAVVATIQTDNQAQHTFVITSKSLSNFTYYQTLSTAGYMWVAIGY
jgi:hypothetical protein